MAGKKYILDQAVAARKMRRMALEILEQNTGEPGIILVGIEGSGAVVARSIHQMIREEGSLPVQYISLSLDKRRPAEVKLSETPDFTGKIIILVDAWLTAARRYCMRSSHFSIIIPAKYRRWYS